MIVEWFRTFSLARQRALENRIEKLESLTECLQEQRRLFLGDLLTPINVRHQPGLPQKVAAIEEYLCIHFELREARPARWEAVEQFVETPDPPQKRGRPKNK